MPENWKSYFANVNEKLSSIALDLALCEYAPMADKPWLLWVWIYLQSPRPDGLSDRSEFPTICAIEDELAKQFADNCDGIYAGRITGDSRRELYFYGADKKNFKRAVKDAMSGFRSYRFDFDAQHEPDWNQYFNVLYPSDEDMQRIANRDVLDALEKEGDTLKPVRDVHHWIYFKTAEDRAWYTSKVRELGYTIEHQSEDQKEERPYALTITRDQSVTPEAMDHAVLELFRLAKQIDADYDGWEAQVIQTQ
jgi:uncharacterized protein (TIGR01619 family)